MMMHAQQQTQIESAARNVQKTTGATSGGGAGGGAEGQVPPCGHGLRGGGLGDGAQSRSQLVLGCRSQLDAPSANSKLVGSSGDATSHSFVFVASHELEHGSSSSASPRATAGRRSLGISGSENPVALRGPVASISAQSSTKRGRNVAISRLRGNRCT
tara:strand:- start:248 stop:721 length:474 start_codon:yes stop_codon:yes gene_type:complete